MNLSASQRAIVLEAIESGVRKISQRLAKITEREWRVRPSLRSDGPGRRFLSFLGSGVEAHRGAYFGAQDGRPLGVLVVFHDQAAASVAGAFTAAYGERVRQVPDLENAALAEISNILAQGMASALGDALGTILLVSAPQTVSGPRHLLLEGVLDRFPDPEPFAVLARLGLTQGGEESDCLVMILAGRALFAQLLEGALR